MCVQHYGKLTFDSMSDDITTLLNVEPGQQRDGTCRDNEQTASHREIELETYNHQMSSGCNMSL